MTISGIESCCHNFSILGRNKTVIIAVHQSITDFVLGYYISTNVLLNCHLYRWFLSKDVNGIDELP